MYIYIYIYALAEAAGRTKAYLHAEVGEGGTRLHLHVDKLLPPQSW